MWHYHALIIVFSGGKCQITIPNYTGSQKFLAFCLNELILNTLKFENLTKEYVQ